MLVSTCSPVGHWDTPQHTGKLSGSDGHWDTTPHTGKLRGSDGHWDTAQHTGKLGSQMDIGTFQNNLET